VHSFGLAAAVLLTTGCTQILGLDSPKLVDSQVVNDVAHDANMTDAPRGDGSVNDAASAVCPTGYLAVSGLANRYRVVVSPLTWLNAEQTCESDSSSASLRTHLAVVTSDSERTTLSNTTGANEYWIGLSDRLTEGTYLWVSTETTPGYPPSSGGPWGTGEPSVNGAATDCVELQSDSVSFAVRDCQIAKRYICECDGFAAKPQNY
jgi:hypothetical protein